jgi:chromosome segregation ATPase
MNRNPYPDEVYRWERSMIRRVLCTLDSAACAWERWTPDDTIDSQPAEEERADLIEKLGTARAEQDELVRRISVMSGQLHASDSRIFEQCRELDALEDELARMRPVVEAAEHWLKEFVREHEWTDSLVPAEERMVAAVDDYQKRGGGHG